MKNFLLFLILIFSKIDFAFSDENWTFYDVDYSIENSRPDGQGAWFSMNPNNPYMVPNDGHEYRTADPDHRNGYSSGLYLSNDPKIIKLHAYWMKALGINTVVIDWTNLRLTNSAKHPSAAYFDAIVRNTYAVANTYRLINDFVPPKIVIAMRLYDIDQQAINDARLLSNLIHDLYKQFPESNEYIDSIASPALIIFSPFEKGNWINNQYFIDARFNIRYMGGFLYENNNLTSNHDGLLKRISNNLPYWSFIENYRNDTNLYGNVIRLKSTSNNQRNEFSTAWIAIPSYREPYAWDGVWSFKINGLHTFERQLESLQNSKPEILMVGRFNYAKGVFNQPQEGLFEDSVQSLEPTEKFHFKIFDLVRSKITIFRDAPRYAPSLHSIVNTGNSIQLSWGQFPTEYQISSTPDFTTASWNYVTSPTINVLRDNPSEAIYIRTRNTFGTTPWLGIWPKIIVPSTLVRIISQHSGKCLDVTHASSSNGVLIQQWTCNNFLQQAWLIEDSGNGYYRFRNQLSGKYLDIKNASIKNEALLQQWDGNGHQQQDYMIVKNYQSYIIINRLSGKSLDVISASFSNGTNVQQWDLNGFSQQLWRIEPW